MNLVVFLLQSSKRAVALSILFGILSGAATSALLGVIHRASMAERFSGNLALTFAALVVLAMGLRVVSQRLLVRLVQDAVLDLRMRLTRAILAMPLRQLEELGAARLLSILTEDIVALAAVLPGLTIVATNGAVIVACLLYMAWLSLSGLGVVVAFMVVGVGSYNWVAMRAMRRLTVAREQQDVVFKHLRAAIEGLKELKLDRLQRQSFLETDLGEALGNYRQTMIASQTTYVVAASWGNVLFLVAVAVLLFGVGRVPGIDVHAATGFALALLYMMTPLESTMNMMPMLARGTATLNKVQSLAPTLLSEAEPARLLPPAAAASLEIELRGVSHTYASERDNRKFVLGPIDLSLRGGEVVFLVGGNGSGKSTLAKVLSGLYVPETGELRLGGEPVRDDTRDAYRQQFAAVFSDYYLFDRVEGIGQGAAERAPKYLAELQLDHKVSIEGGTLSTTALSQGQRKRLALLVAYLQDRPVYLFDEWASDQDPLFKGIFYTEILADLRKRGKLVFVITHDDRYFSCADRVLKLDEGKLSRT
jgi:putative ATP-binding cassette transporter